jgi:hypothetical protein
MKTVKQFNFLMKKYDEKKSGAATSDRMKKVARDELVGNKGSHNSMEAYRGRKLNKKLNKWHEAFTNWPTDVEKQFQVMQELTSGRSFMPEVIDAVKMVLSGSSEWEASREVGVTITNVIWAREKICYFQKAAQDYKKLLE